MVDERNPISSRTSKLDSSKIEKQVYFSVPPLDASKFDISNPYFTHHSNHPTWRRAMTLALNAKNKLGFVNGTIKAPSEETHPDDYATWSHSVIDYVTAHEVWEDLRERFSQSNAPHIFEIK
ncbi:hypothetical protein AAG906_032930 [Vitis piasezkii]